MKLPTNYKTGTAGFGFTLIELLVVISIIGILATLVVANLNSARSRARDAERKSDMKAIATALKLYFNDYGTFPATGSLPWDATWTGSNGVTYMNEIPQDPLPGQSYYYRLVPGTIDKYYLSACLENQSDPSAVTGQNGQADSSCIGKATFLIQE